MYLRVGHKKCHLEALCLRLGASQLTVHQVATCLGYLIGLK